HAIGADAMGSCNRGQTTISINGGLTPFPCFERWWSDPLLANRCRLTHLAIAQQDGADHAGAARGGHGCLPRCARIVLSQHVAVDLIDVVAIELSGHPCKAAAAERIAHHV